MFFKNQELTLTILELNMMGYGVAKHDGAVFFVRDALPGEECLCGIIKCAKNYYVARVIKRLNVSPDRRTPHCDSWKACGGCVFQHCSYELEIETKRNYVLDCARKADLTGASVLPVLATDRISRYRNKAQYPVTQKSGELIAGFYGCKTHKVVPVKDCAIQNAAFSAILESVLAFCQEHKVCAYSEETGEGLLRHVYIRIGEKTGEVMLCLVLTADGFPEEDRFVTAITKKHPEIKSIVFNINPEDTNVVLGKKDRLVWGGEVIFDVLCEKRFALSPHSFYQVNHDGAELLYQTAFQIAGIDPDTVLLDLYCGVGTIGQCAAREGQRIYGVEIIEQAVRNAVDNAACNGLKNARYYSGDAALFFDRIPNEDKENALLILDPPRKGLSEELICKIASSSVNKVLYISCNPQTLTRDLSSFSAKGFSFGAIQPVDLFPRTGHVETVVLMSRVKD